MKYFSVSLNVVFVKEVTDAKGWEQVERRNKKERVIMNRSRICFLFIEVG
jgi:hypothetical protein